MATCPQIQAESFNRLIVMASSQKAYISKDISAKVGRFRSAIIA
jgi:hypothetical protein